MKFSSIVCLLLVSLWFPFSSEGQSLGSVAKKERDRRDKNKKEGVSAREFTEEEVFGKEEEKEAEEGEVPAGEDEESAEGGEGAEVQDEGSSTALEGVDVRIDENERSERESRNRKRSEAEWRARASAARSRVASARERVQMLEGLFLPQGGRYVDVNGNTVIESLEHLQSLVQEAKEELTEAERSLVELQDEARRAGIPPGWIR
ncbi:MAG: hypothetical protein ACRD3V_16920 [Vicinamibacteria bacterium]